MCLMGQGDSAWLWGRGHGQGSAWGLCSHKLRVGTVGCNALRSCSL